MLQDVLDIYTKGQQAQNLSPVERGLYKVLTQIGPQTLFSVLAAALAVATPALTSSAPINVQHLAMGVAVAIGLSVVGTGSQGLAKWFAAHGEAPLASATEVAAAAAQTRLGQAARAYGVPNDVVTGFEIDPAAIDPHAMTQVQPAAYYQPPKPGAGPNVHGYDLADLDTQERGAVGVQRSSVGIRGHQWHQPDDASEDEESEPEPGRTRPASTPASALHAAASPPANSAHAVDELHTQPAIPAVRPAVRVPVRTPGVPPRVLNQIAPADSGFLR